MATLLQLSFASAHKTYGCTVLFISSFFSLCEGPQSPQEFCLLEWCVSVSAHNYCAPANGGKRCQGERKRDWVFLESAAQLGDLILGSRDLAPWQCPLHC